MSTFQVKSGQTAGEKGFQDYRGTRDWKTTSVKRDSILGAGKVFRLVKLKLAEFDGFGISVFNLRFGVDVVLALIHLDQLYGRVSEQEFEQNLQRHFRMLFATVNKFERKLEQVTTLVQLRNTTTDEIRAEYMREMNESCSLIINRYRKLRAYLTTIQKSHIKLTAFVEKKRLLSDIAKKNQFTLASLNRNKQMIHKIQNEELKGYLYEELNSAKQSLKFQSKCIQDCLIMIMDNMIFFNSESRVKQCWEKQYQEKLREKIKNDEYVYVLSDDGIKIDLEKMCEAEEVEDKRCFVDKMKTITSYSANVLNSACASNETDGNTLSHTAKPLISACVECEDRKPTEQINFIRNYLKSYQQNEERLVKKCLFIKNLIEKRERLKRRKQQVAEKTDTYKSSRAEEEQCVAVVYNVQNH